MDKEVLITLKGLQINEPVDTGVVEIVALGEYYEKNDKKYIIYEEVVEGMEGKIKNIIKLSPTCMEVTKKGLTNTHMVFEENKKNLTVYNTPFGAFSLGIMAKGIDIDEQDDSMSVKVEYELDMNYEHVADCTISLGVQSKNLGSLSLS
ncbi:MAG: DUF1934 domain-containing protein [Lachnospiraceae bacterium]|jgi:uncharacterized beta-barrel protein YwiB (DUF1934 family)|nr:DUF1934 domain-containing protein [Lachnospiraceae bacterium]